MKEIVLVLFFSLSCSVIRQSTTDITLFYIEKTACYGECPVYKAEIFMSGKMILQGIANTKFKGRYCGIIDTKDLNWLIDEFKRENYFSFNEAYLSRVKDLPTTITSFNYEGHQKRVLDYDKAPPALKKLEKLLETLIDTSEWKTCK